MPPTEDIPLEKISKNAGIFSPNASGKSSILYAILQGFFNSSNRTGGRNVADVIHKNKDEGFIEIDFSIDNTRYVIERKFKRNKRNPNRANNKVELFQIINNEKVNISGNANVRETENTIRTLLGSYEEHTMTTFSQQFDITRFIDHGQTNRKDLLARFLGLNVIDDLQKAIKDETASIKSILKEYQQNDYPSILNRFEEEHTDIVGKINELKERKGALEEKLSNAQKLKDDLFKSLHPVYEGLRVLEDIESDVSQSTTNIKELGSQEKKNHDGGYVHRKGTYYAANDRIKELQWELQSKQEKISHHQGQSGILDRHDWFDTNDTCKKCSFLTGAFHSRRLVEEENILLKSLEEEFEDKRKELEEYKDFPREEKLYEKCEKEVGDLKSKLQNLEMVFENITLQLELEKNKLSSYKEERKTYKKNESSIKHNDNVGRELAKLEGSIATLESNLKSNNDEITQGTSYLGQISQKIVDLGGNIEVLKEIEKKYVLHELLMDAFGNDGIPLMILNKAVPLINSEIRKILSNITNFEVFLEVDTEAHDLSIFIDDGNTRL